MGINKTINLKDKKHGNTECEVLLEKSDNLLVVRFERKTPDCCDDYFSRFNAVVRFCVQSANVFVIELGDNADTGSIKNELRKDPELKFVGNAFIIDNEPVIYTGNIITIFEDNMEERACLDFFSQHNLKVKQHVSDIGNVWMVTPENGVDSSVFELSHQIIANPDIEACYPEIVRFRSMKAIHPNQWHLKPTLITYQAYINASANVEEAHKTTRGEGIVVAIIDDGVDVTHPEFSSPGKVVHPANFSGKVAGTDPMPENISDYHGTACAGVAVASGVFGASGVAPAAKLMPIRTDSLGSMNDAKAFLWAADHGADVISCSWGPKDGDWLNPDSPLHQQKVDIPPHTDRAIRYAVEKGRNGKGCVIFFASGNGNESVDNDGYASHPLVMAVAASNSDGQRSCYSDYGQAVFCCFPSDDVLASSTPGIWTTTLTNALGDNRSTINRGDIYGNYINNFGGTSSACPGAAGIAALVLAVKPELEVGELKSMLRVSCDKIGIIGEKYWYDKDGHSPLYGYGRLNAGKAVNLAKKSK